MHCRKFRKPCNGDRRDEESPFFDCWDGKHQQSDVSQQVDPWARKAPKSVPSVKSFLSVNFPVCSVCQKLGVYQHLPSKAPQHDISSEEKVDLMKFQLQLPRVTTPQERVVSSRGTAYLWDKILRVTLKAPGSTRYSQEWNRGEMSTNSGSYSVQPATGNRDIGVFSEHSGGLSDSRATGNREYNDEGRWPDEVDLNTVTIGNMSTDSKPVETDGKRGRYREITVDSGAGESVVNPDDWPNVDLKPSKKRVIEGKTIRGPWR